MAFRISTRQATAGDRSGTVFELSNTQGTARAEVWPFTGFNCLKWQIDGRDLLYSAPDWESNPVPTRSGHPVLFPFPNRLAKGRMTLEGVAYQLPLTEATKTHAIHGFTPRQPWRVLGSGVTDRSAFVTARFRIRDEVENAAGLWPGDGAITLTYTLTDTSLLVDADVENFGEQSFPYGIGYHGYFRLPTADADERIDPWHFLCQAESLWECVANIPTGVIVPTPAELNFASERPLGPVLFDTLLTGLASGSGLRTLATLRHPEKPGVLSIHADDSFPHLVLFTPAHRKAFAIEPYTCATNAANLPSSVPNDWRALMPGAKNSHHVEYRWQSTEKS
jgi:aldose 1-epimerase